LFWKKLQGHSLYEIAVVDLDTGMRRRELLAVRLSDLDLDAASIRVERSLEETKDGLRFKPHKTKRSRRTLSLPPNTVAVLREHRRKLLETRVKLGLGKPSDDALLFAQPDGSPMSPNQLSRLWRSQIAQAAARITCIRADCGRAGRRHGQSALGAQKPHGEANTYGLLFKGGAAVAVATMRTRGEQ